MSPEIIDVQTNRRCGRTQEFGRLLKKESKRREGRREGNEWVKIMRQRLDRKVTERRDEEEKCERRKLEERGGNEEDGRRRRGQGGLR